MREDRQLRVLQAIRDGRYSCNEAGTIFSFVQNTPREIKQHLSRCGYSKVYLYFGSGSKDRLILRTHQFVWLFFRGTYNPSLQINHIDGNKLNNSISNLEVTSKQLNIRHAIRLGLRRTKIPESSVPEIIDLISKGVSQVELANTFGVSKSTVSALYRGRSWKNL